MEFKYTDDNKRYHTLSYYNRHKYGRKMFKAVIDAGFTCPNKDGKKGVGGCVFCRGGSGYFTGDPENSVFAQLDAETERIRRKNPNVGIIAYFQANTNTYAPVEVLKRTYFPLAESKKADGISIGTRADCISQEIADFLQELSQMTDLTVELGMQTIHDATLIAMNTGCLHKEFLDGYYRLKDRNIRTCLHIINGLPGETADMMVETVRETSKLFPDAVKIQLLHVLEGTALAELYLQEKVRNMEREEYISLVTKQLELLPPEVVVERITGDGDKRYLIAPKWSCDKIAVLGGIDKLMAEKDSWQGKKYWK